MISSFKVSSAHYTHYLFKQVWIIHLLREEKKYFLYKIVLLAIYIRDDHEKVRKDKEGIALPVGEEDRDKILAGLATEYYNHENHSKWVEFIIRVINRSFKYFNFLDDLFNNYEYHIEHYHSEEFKMCLGYLDIFVRLFGQRLFKECLYDVKFR